MKLIEIKITSYDNWIRYNDQSLKDDFVEYQKKETSKWKTRAKSLEFRFPIFKSLEDFKDALDNAKIIDIDKSGLNIENMTTNNSIESIKSMVSGYSKPRDVDRIVDGFSKNVKLPLPIILKDKRGYHIMAGNTRQSTARVLGIKPKALLVDVS